MQNQVRLAVIGVGNMGSHHAQDIATLPNTKLAAVCDIDAARLQAVSQRHEVRAYHDYADVLANSEIDGVVIATPHYDHMPITVAALDAGKHVLVEKPIAVETGAARRMLEAYTRAKKIQPGLAFGAVFMMRTYGYWRKIKALIDSGELGQLVRATWIITNWFRTQAYYDSCGWRATWAGEGGGVLMNQAPHNLDLYQWLLGMPACVRGFVSFGKYHDVEVEDEVTAYFEHDNGMIGHFIASTGESPGTNRLEIVGEHGKLVFEDERIRFTRNHQSMFAHSRQTRDPYKKVETQDIDVPYTHHGESGHARIIANFADAILHGTPLIAPAVEGIHAVTLNNAIVLSALEKRMIDLPHDEAAFRRHLDALIAESRYDEAASAARVAVDLSSAPWRH